MKKHLSEGMQIEASIVARLLGIKLLKLDARIVIVPPDVVAPSTTPVAARSHMSAVSPQTDQKRSAAPERRSLADAVRNIDEGAELLAEARRNGG